MRLTKTTSHAVRILLDCALAGDERTKVADIAKRLNITQLNVFKVVGLLSHAGFVEATRGRYGGVRLSRRAIEVAGLEQRRRTRYGDTKPQLSSIFDDALEAFISVLDQHNLADLATAARSGNRSPGVSPRRGHIKMTSTKSTRATQARDIA
jgi:Rrf2 family transcriptional regulator, nitric oxide-sensitive transcriptional repressor